VLIGAANAATSADAEDFDTVTTAYADKAS